MAPVLEADDLDENDRGLLSASEILQPSRRFKCLTLNVLSSPVPCNRMEGERLESLLRHIREQGYDLVAFQELIRRHWYDPYHQARHRDFVEGLRAMGYRHNVSGPEPDSALVPYDGGIAIFSKHPIVRHSTHLWQEQASWDAYASKGIVHALIEIEHPCNAMPSVTNPNTLQPARLHVMTLHAQASHVGWQNTSSSTKYDEIRLGQTRQVAEVIRTEAGDGESVLVLGDFNFDARNESELRLHQAELQRCGRKVAPVDVVASSFEGDHPATYGLRNETGDLVEKFLTTTGTLEHEQCLDQVFYWPRESESRPQLLDGTCDHTVVVSQVQCRRELCEYDGPANMFGKKPKLVSDHCGWSVHMDFSWPEVLPVVTKRSEFAPPHQTQGVLQTMLMPAKSMGLSPSFSCWLGMSKMLGALQYQTLVSGARSLCLNEVSEHLRLDK